MRSRDELNQFMDTTWGIIPPEAVGMLMAWLKEHYQTLDPADSQALCDYLARHGGALYRETVIAAMKQRGFHAELATLPEE